MSSKVGDTLKEARKTAGLTQKEVAKRAGIHYNHYYRIENNLAEPTVEVVEKIAKVLNVKSSDIFSF
jgi:transcriptional regulator with XRE-family HTH domain